MMLLDALETGFAVQVVGRHRVEHHPDAIDKAGRREAEGLIPGWMWA
jgi:hypothetical protein